MQHAVVNYETLRT